jgi:hypothetical protein
MTTRVRNARAVLWLYLVCWITVAPPHVEMGNEMAGGCCICTKLLGLSNAGSAAGCSKDRVVITLVATGSEQTVGEIQAKSQLAVSLQSRTD